VLACAAFASLALLGACAPPRGPSSAVVELGPERLLPARMRRLSNYEYERTASELLGRPVEVADALPPDVRQEGYSRNAEQALPPSLGTRLAALAEGLAERAVSERLDELAPCRTSGSRACRDAFLQRYASRAFRRPVTPEELGRLARLFDRAGAAGEGFPDGARGVLRALLQAPALLYVSELGGPAPPGGVATLDSFEIASALSYLLRGGPPDAELLTAAASGALRDARARRRQARRLLGLHDTRHQFRRFVLEWLEVDQLEHTAKDETAFPEYAELKRRMLDETRDFIDEVMVHRGASIHALLGAGFASIDPDMARFYGLHAYGPRVSLAGTGRLGLLQQASFLSAHAHPDSTSPVKRGDFVLRKVLCVEMPRPSELGIEVAIPPLDLERTARERFSAHADVPGCRSCHSLIDPIGFSFEAFDAMGRSRKAGGRFSDTRASFELSGRSYDFASSAELTRWLAGEPRTQKCFLRHAYRFFMAESDPAREASFLDYTSMLPPEVRGNLLEVLVAYVGTRAFITRKVGAP
jgi:hypothetical protein